MLNPHGDFKSALNQQLLQFSARGPWNDVTMKNGTVEVGQLIASIAEGQPWAQLSCLFGESLMPPSTFDIFVKQTQRRKEKGLSFLAVVILDTDIERTTKRQIKQCYELAGVNFAFFNSVHDALNNMQQRSIAFDRQEAEHFFERFNFTRKPYALLTKK
jgi:hypothetical protein